MSMSRQTLLPAYNRGERRRPYRRTCGCTRLSGSWRGTGSGKAPGRCGASCRQLPSRDPDDPAYRRLRYVRYCDDWLLGFTGTRREAEEIKDKLGAFLRDQLKLELSEPKTLITHGRTHAARFLGYEIVVHHDDTKHDRHGHRSINGAIGLKVPMDVVRAK